NCTTKEASKSGKSSVDLCETQFRALALRFSCFDRALPQGEGSLAHRTALSRAGRLLRIEAEAFRIFFQHVGNTVAIPWRPAPYHYRHCWKFLRPLYRERRLYARLRTSCSLRLRYFEHRKREQGGFAVDETLSQSRYPPFPAHFFWETAPITSVERDFYFSDRPRSEHHNGASEKVANVSARSHRQR